MNSKVILNPRGTWVGGKVEDAIVTISCSSRPLPTRSRVTILNHDKILSLLRQSIKRFCSSLKELFHFLHPQKLLRPPVSTFIYCHQILHSSRLVWCCSTPSIGQRKQRETKIINTLLILFTSYFSRK